MGCDIHIYVEKKNKNGVWETVKGVNQVDIDEYTQWINDPDFKGNKEYYKGRIKELQEGSFKDWIYSGRNYGLFAILANVRNGYGFAGCDTGDGYKPISLPKGLPDNVTDMVKQDSDEWDCDGHSHSWLTVKELLNYNWLQVTKKRGVVDEEQYKRFKETGEPYPCSGGVWGRNVENVDNETMEKIISGEIAKEGKDYYTQIQWEETYKDAANFEKEIEILKNLGNPEDVRIVFWFDN